MTNVDNERESQFWKYCRALTDLSFQIRSEGLFAELSEYDQQTIALAGFNQDYGGNGLVDYVAWHGREFLDHTLRGLVCIGASRLAAIVRAYYDLLQNHEYSFDDPDCDVYEFIEEQPEYVQKQFDDLQAEAADLYSSFYARWWHYHFERGSDELGTETV